MLALFVDTFLHLVVGEMVPKSRAIAHPERSAILLAMPMRANMTITRPLLRALNGAANWLVRRAGEQTVDSLGAGQDPESLRHLVEHSANVGALDASYRDPLSTALKMRESRLIDVASGGELASVGPQALRAMKESRTHLIVVTADDTEVGVATMTDILPRLLPNRA